jgi:predicted glutamine amidotransferase
MSRQTGYVVATKPLTNEAWTPFACGQLIVFRRGEIVFSGISKYSSTCKAPRCSRR